MPRQALTCDTGLDVHLAAICSRHPFTDDPAPTIAELRRVAGRRNDLLAHVAAGWADWYDNDDTATLAAALRQLASDEHRASHEAQSDSFAAPIRLAP